MTKKTCVIAVCWILLAAWVAAEAQDPKLDPWTKQPAKGQAVYTYTAETIAPAKKHGKVVAFKVAWTCEGSRCQATGPWVAPAVPACHALAMQVGQVRSYGRPGAQLDQAALKRCNDGVPAPSRPVIRQRLPGEIYTPGRVHPDVLDTLVRSGRIRLFPTGPKPPPVTGIRSLGPLRALGSLELRTLQNQLYQGPRANEYYYLPRAIRLLRDPATGYRMTALPVDEDKIRLSLVLTADQDPADVALMDRLVKEEHGSAARLLPLPYDDAEIKDLDALEGWEIEPVRLPSYGSLDSEIPLDFSMPAGSFADLKAVLENVGLGGGFVLKTAEQEHAVNVQISLLYPTGAPYSPLRDVSLGYDPGGPHVVLGNVRNLTAFPMTVDGVDLEVRFPDWSQPEIFTDLRVDPSVRIEPGARATLRARIQPSSRFQQELARLGLPGPATSRRGAGGGRSADTLGAMNMLVKLAPRDKQKQGLGLLRNYAAGGSLDETDRQWVADLAREVLDGGSLMGKERGMLQDLIAEMEGGAAGTDAPQASDAPVASVPALQEAAVRYSLRNTIDASCQRCLDEIWDRLEVVGYLERRQQLQVEAIPAAFSEAYRDGSRLQALNVDLKSPFFSASPRGGVEVPRSLVLTEGQLGQSLEIYLPTDSSQVLSFQYRLEVIAHDGSRFRGDWVTREDSLSLLITNADVRALLGAGE